MPSWVFFESMALTHNSYSRNFIEFGATIVSQSSRNYICAAIFFKFANVKAQIIYIWFRNNPICCQVNMGGSRVLEYTLNVKIKSQQWDWAMWERYPISSLWTLALYTFLRYLRIEHPWEIPFKKMKNEVSYIIFPALPPQLQSGDRRWELCSISFLRRCRHRCISQSHTEHYFKDIWSFPLKLRGNLCFKETFRRCKQDAYW